ncbi:MAG: pyridoxal phosphate-dependent aminotransferase [candidate division Zixibacteria bacterium]|nr:pyridoxal phosphate-dependent aminotransferase [candidate division Zixibacteria bacterium]
MNLSKRLARVAPSATTALNDRAIAMRREGRHVLNFAVGEPDFPTPEHIRNAGIEAIWQGITRYTPATGTMEIKQAICDKLLRDNGLRYTPPQITTASGGKHALYNLLFVLCDDGDEVIVPAPYWVSYPEMVKLVGAEPVILTTGVESDFKITPDRLRAAITPRTKALILNSPSNPTGMVYSKDELAALAEVVAETDLFVISDELYEKILYDDWTHHSIASVHEALFEKTLLVNGVSKAYAMTGWRLGYAAGPQFVMDAVSKFLSQTVMHPSAITQHAAITALTGPEDFLIPMRREFLQRRDYILSRFRRIPGVTCLTPGGAFYVFPDLSAFFGHRLPDGRSVRGSYDLSLYLLEHFGVVTVPGLAFGAEGCIRLSYATSMEIIEQGMNLIETALSQLQS